MVRILAFSCAVAVVTAKTKLRLGQDTNYPPYAYEEDGKPAGFGGDIARGMNTMCPDLDIEVVITEWSQCWTPHGLGEGLNNGTLDACMTYTHTKGVRNEFADFSYGILEVNKAAGLLTMLDENGAPKVNGHDDLKGKKVVDVAGWAPTADGLDFVVNKCTGKPNDVGYELLVADGAANNNQLALDMLFEGKADVMFVYADQAYNYKKVCKKSGAQGVTWDCDKWNKFGKKFAYVQTGQFGYVNNGTTLALAKKGSGVVELLNPCLDKFMKTKEYFEVCDKYDKLDTCYRNEFFPPKGEVHEKEYNKATDEHAEKTDCSSGYCPCTGGAEDFDAALHTSRLYSASLRKPAGIDQPATLGSLTTAGGIAAGCAFIAVAMGAFALGARRRSPANVQHEELIPLDNTE